MKEHARITLRIDPKIFSLIKEKAKGKNLTFNQYIESLCRKELTASGEMPETGGTRPYSYMTISLSKEERDLIETRSAETGLSYREIIRKLLCQSCPAIINIEVYDILKLEETINPYISTIYGIAKVILRTEKVFPADLEKLLSLTEQIYKAVAEVIRLETAGRDQLYEEARKKYFPEIESTKQIRKRLKGTKEHGSDKD